RDGMIGNIYSMGLALQALGATREFYAPREWDCAQAFSVVTSHDYKQPMAIAQVLPALVGRSYLDVARLDCSRGSGMLRGMIISPVTSQIPRDGPLSTGYSILPLSTPSPASITVQYSITNKLQGKHFHYSTWVTVPSGSRLLRVLEVAEEEDPQTFSFQTEQTSWGPMVVSIHGLAANDKDRTYWQFLSSGNALEEGVGTYKPKDQEHIQAVFSTW
ncbi:IF factor, partial [Serilophus lunatus]|nr:IF factor [Serilophus lunatus]